MRLTFFILIFLLTVIYVAQSEKLVKKRRIKKIIPRIREEITKDILRNDFKKQRKFYRRKKILPLIPKPPKLQQYDHQKVIKSTKPDIFNITQSTEGSMESSFPKLKIEKNNNNEAFNRSQNHPRFLSIFTIIRFDNDICTAGTGDNGTCYSDSECSKLGGTASGSCAQGFGVCCLFSKTCGDSTDRNGTHFQNEGYPGSFDNVASCELRVNKCDNNVCQLRLDLINFVMRPPESTDHKCQDDQFIVSGGSPVPSICGTNTGAHMYIDMGLGVNNPITLNMVSNGASFSRSFNIKVTQIYCNSLSRAEDGCLQYYTGITGNMFTYNYNDASGLMLSNTDYTICVRTERNFCGIQYSTCVDTLNNPTMSFSITGQGSEGSNVGTNCNTDWVSIPCATNGVRPAIQADGSTCVDRICGMVFNSIQDGSLPSVSISSFTKPFHLRVHTDDLEGSADVSNRGFCLNFVQQPCSTNNNQVQQQSSTG